MAEVRSPITAPGIADWLGWLAGQLEAGAISLAGRAHQLASMGIHGANVALSYPGAYLESFLTGQPATVPEYRPYDPWQDPLFVEAQRRMGRKVPGQPASTVRASEGQSEAAKGQVSARQGTGQKGSGSPANASPTRTNQQSPLQEERIPVTPVPDQILTGMAPTIEDLRKQGLQPTYFFAPAEVWANADRPLIGSSMPNVGKATAALEGPVPDQVLLGYYPSLAAMQAVGAQPTYFLQSLYQRPQATLGVQRAGAQATTGASALPEWYQLFRKQQDLLDVLGGVSEKALALRVAARRALETPGASVADLYWEQGIEPLLRRYGYSEEQLRQKHQELRELEQVWRDYGAIQDFAEFLWVNGYDPFS